MNDKCDFESVTPEIWMANEEGWREKLLKLQDWRQIPLINCNASHNLSDKRLVRFRGMIQDMHNPEFYFEKYEVLNKVTNEVKIKSGKYCDTADMLENESINYTENFKGAQRHTIVVISMPGLNDWAQNMEEQQNVLKHLEHQPNTSKRLQADTKLKRSYDEAEEDANAMEVEGESTKEMKTNETVNETSSIPLSREHLLNFPLPDMPSKSCIVKIYQDSDQLHLNNMVEVIGFLSVDPALSGEFRPEKNEFEPEFETEAETITHNPPPSLVPRIHAVYVKKLKHCNPLVKEDIEQSTIMNEASTAREHLMKALTELLLGDELAAQYLICNLLSNVYTRKDIVTFGQFSLNIFNLPIVKYPNYAKQLYDIIKQFVTKSYYLPLTIENLNTMALQPKKDYECNRLTSGILQLSDHTHLVLDETKMQQGTLNANGVANVTALGDMLQDQRVEYDFKFYKMKFDCDIPCLILSEGKSLLPGEYLVCLKPEQSSLEIFDAIVEAATYYLKEEIMNIIRSYITSIRLIKFVISDNLQFVEDDIIKMRNQSDRHEYVKIEDYHRMVVLGRLVSLSYGHNVLTKEYWEIAKTMETERLRRLKNRAAALL